MPGRIIEFIKNIIKTLKNELKGPLISEKSLKIEKGSVLSKEVGKEVIVDKKEIMSEVKIIDLKDSEKVEIKELTLKKTCNNILFFNKTINVENNNINFKDIGVVISKKDIEKCQSKIKRIEIRAQKKEFKIKKTELINQPILNGSEKIFKIPQKITGRKADDFYKSEYEVIYKKIADWALKKGNIDTQKMEIEYVFEKIPVQCIKNIKYDGATGRAELFFDEKNRGLKTMDFAIILNTETGIREKIFI